MSTFEYLLLVVMSIPILASSIIILVLKKKIFLFSSPKDTLKIDQELVDVYFREIFFLTRFYRWLGFAFVIIIIISAVSLSVFFILEDYKTSHLLFCLILLVEFLCTKIIFKRSDSYEKKFSQILKLSTNKQKKI